MVNVGAPIRRQRGIGLRIHRNLMRNRNISLCGRLIIAPTGSSILGTITINLPHFKFQFFALFVRRGQPSTTTVIARRPKADVVTEGNARGAISGKEVSIFLYTN